MTYPCRFFPKLLCLYYCLLPLHLPAQSDSTARQEIWPEYNLFYRIAPQHRIYFQMSGTRQRASSYSEGSVGLLYDYFFFHRNVLLQTNPDSTRGFNFWFRGGYLFSSDPPGKENTFTENILLTELNGRFWPFEHFMLSAKSRFDLRFNSGDFQPRFRQRITLERDIRTEYATFTPYAYGEFFLYPGNRQLNRGRLSAGIEFWIFKFLSFEFYYLYQFRNQPDVNAVSAVGVVVKNYFSQRQKKNNRTTKPNKS